MCSLHWHARVLRKSARVRSRTMLYLPSCWAGGALHGTLYHASMHGKWCGGVSGGTHCNCRHDSVPSQCALCSCATLFALHDAAGRAPPQQQLLLMRVGSLYRFIGRTPTGWQNGRPGANSGARLGLRPSEFIGVTLRRIKQSATARCASSRHTLCIVLPVTRPL